MWCVCYKHHNKYTPTLSLWFWMNTKIVANMNCMAYISSTKAIKARRHGDSSSLDGKSCLPSQIGQQQFNKRICYVFEGKNTISNTPSGNQTWHWKLHYEWYFWLILPFKPPFRAGIRHRMSHKSQIKCYSKSLPWKLVTNTMANICILMLNDNAMENTS